MSEKCYFISEASKLVGVEAHVLRYWEEQLELPIKRNEMGHRYYIEEDIRLMQSIRQVMEKGMQLRAVKMLLPGLMKNQEATWTELVGETIEMCPQEDMPATERLPVIRQEQEVASEEGALPTRVSRAELTEEARENRMLQFQEIMMNLIGQALRQNNPELAAATSEQVTDKVSEKVIKEMDYLLRMKENQEEERFKKLDETIRNLQKTRAARSFRKGKK